MAEEQDGCGKIKSFFFKCVKSEMHIGYPSGDGKYAAGIQGKGPGQRHEFGSCQHVDSI